MSFLRSGFEVVCVGRPDLLRLKWKRKSTKCAPLSLPELMHRWQEPSRVCAENVEDVWVTSSVSVPWSKLTERRTYLRC